MKTFHGSEIGRLLRLAVLAMPLSALVAGCRSTTEIVKPGQMRFGTQPEAGTVHVGVQSVTPFEDLIDQLQPTFSLTADQAFQAAIPDTQLEELRTLRSMLLQIALALPSRTKTSTDTTTTTDGDVTRTTLEEKKVTPGTATPGALPDANDLIDALAFNTTPATALDPVLRYKAASALFQEVTLLSNYVRDAAMPPGTRPYIVRLLITVLPSARRAPYDVYTSVSFFSRPRPTAYRTDDWLLYGPGGSYAMEEAARQRVSASLSELLEHVSCPEAPIESIPLFVTDNLEASLLSSSSQAERDLGFSANLPVNNAGFGVAGENRSESSRRSFGRDLNALFTVGRASPETIEVRLGAAVVEGGRQMLARTYNLTALLLVQTGKLETFVREDKVRSLLSGMREQDRDDLATRVRALTSPSGPVQDGPPRTGEDSALMDAIAAAIPRVRESAELACTAVRFSAFSTLRDAESGRVLSNARGTGLSADLAAADPRLHLTDETRMAALVSAIELNQFARFVTALGENEEERLALLPVAQSLWPIAVSVVRRYGLTGGDFEAPRPQSGSCPRVEDGLVGLDDKKTLTIVVGEAQGLDAKRLLGRLRLGHGVSGQTGGEGTPATTGSATSSTVQTDQALLLTSSSVSIGRDGLAKLTFPSALALVAPKEKAGSVASFTEGLLELSYQAPRIRWSEPLSASICSGLVRIAGTAEVEPKPGFSMKVPSSFLVASHEGVADLAMELRAADGGPEAVFVAVDGAFVTEVSPAPRRKDADYKLATNAAYVLKLSNLLPGSTITVKAWRMEGAKQVSVTPSNLLVLAREEAPAAKKQQGT